MKKLLLFAAILFFCTDSFAQGGKRKSPHDTLTYANGVITYGRPYKHDRDIFGVLVKYGQVWRVGADEATTISFVKDASFGGQDIPAGTYTLFALVNPEEWTVILNTQLGQWGSFAYEKNKDKDIAHIKVKVQENEDVVEQLTISYDEDEQALIIEWDKVKVTIPLSFQSED